MYTHAVFCHVLSLCSTAHQRAVKRNEEQGETIGELERDYEEVKRASEQFEEDVQRKAGQAVELEDAQVRGWVGKGCGLWGEGPSGACIECTRTHT